MPQMRIAAGAANLDAMHAVAEILQLADRAAVDAGPEARPAAAGFVFSLERNSGA